MSFRYRFSTWNRRKCLMKIEKFSQRGKPIESNMANVCDAMRMPTKGKLITKHLFCVRILVLLWHRPWMSNMCWISMYGALVAEPRKKNILAECVKVTNSFCCCYFFMIATQQQQQQPFQSVDYFGCGAVCSASQSFCGSWWVWSIETKLNWTMAMGKVSDRDCGGRWSRLIVSRKMAVGLDLAWKL